MALRAMGAKRPLAVAYGHKRGFAARRASRAAWQGGAKSGHKKPRQPKLAGRGNNGSLSLEARGTAQRISGFPR